MTMMLFVDFFWAHDRGSVGGPWYARWGRCAGRAAGPGYVPRVTSSRYDVVVVGGGHNGLVAAAYLARAGRSVLVLERAAQVGGAAVSQQVFEGVDVRLSAYSYLVSLLPDRIATDLGLEIRLADRSVASFTATERAGRPTGL